jgi:hypothetical protein
MPRSITCLRSHNLVAVVTLLLAVSPLPAQIQFKPPPGTYRTSWVGNTFGGDGGPNGFGYWVQNAADEIEVTPDGTVFAGLSWDEAGRCAGLYKDGKVNRVLLKAPERDKLADSAWGWGTGNEAVAVSGEHLYIGTKGKKLLHFTWKPGELDSASFVAAVNTPAEAGGLGAHGDRVVVVYKDELELRCGSDLKVERRFKVPGARDVAVAADGSLWVLAGDAVRHFSKSGEDLGVSVPGLDKPSAIALDPQDGRLIVCDNGRRQQVLFFSVKDKPQLMATFGEEGGLRAGTPGLATPTKLFGLRGAGTDASGNLYVALGFDNGPNGNLILRSFDPAGKLRWEVVSLAFVDTFGFDPESDGAVVYSRTAVLDLDLTQKQPGREWRLRGFTIDYPAQSNNDRVKYGCSVLVRNLQGRRLLYSIGQYAGGYRLHTFDEPNGLVAREVDRIHGEDKWAWHVAENGDIWHGDASKRTIRRFAFKGWKSNGKPDYDWKKPQTWPWPEDFELVRRIIYQQSNDALYLFGYLKGQKIESWGVVGPTARRYDGWLAGKKSIAWTNRALPANPKGTDEGAPLTPNAVDIAGDYLFVGMVKPEAGKQQTHIYRISDAKYVGTLEPGPEVGGNAGWQDMPYAVQALRRKNGEYLILVEEDWRGKNLLYRWRPARSGEESKGK